MRESLGGKPRGAMKVKSSLSQGGGTMRSNHSRGGWRSIAPSRSLAMGRRKSVWAETRKMVNYS